MASSTAKERSLSGKYSLNKKTSDPISPFLKIAGYSWATRKVGCCRETSEMAGCLLHAEFSRCSPRCTIPSTLQAADAVGLTLTIEQTSESLSGHGSTWLGDGTYRLSFVEVRAEGCSLFPALRCSQFLPQRKCAGHYLL